MAQVSGNSTGSQLAWLESLKTGFNDFKPEQKFLRKVSLPSPCVSGGQTADEQQTSIIGTIGPKTNSVDMLLQLMEAGLNIGERGQTQSLVKRERPADDEILGSPDELLSRIIRVPSVRH